MTLCSLSVLTWSPAQTWNARFHPLCSKIVHDGFQQQRPKWPHSSFVPTFFLIKVACSCFVLHLFSFQLCSKFVQGVCDQRPSVTKFQICSIIFHKYAIWYLSCWDPFLNRLPHDFDLHSIGAPSTYHYRARLKSGPRLCESRILARLKCLVSDS